MPTTLPNTGIVRVRVLQVNTLSRGEAMHDLKVRILPRDEASKPVHVSVRDEVCPRPPVSGDRLKLTMQAGTVAGVELMRAKASTGDAASDASEE
jgi:hypothetical protein